MAVNPVDMEDVRLFILQCKVNHLLYIISNAEIAHEICLDQANLIRTEENRSAALGLVRFATERFRELTEKLRETHEDISKYLERINEEDRKKAKEETSMATTPIEA